MIKSFRGTVKKLIRNYVRGNVETTLPAVVVDISTYQSTQQIAALRPLTNLVFEDNQAVEMPLIYNVPVELTGTQESLISVPIKVGDTVMLKFSKRSLDELKEQATATTYNPRDRRWFDTSDAVAFPTVINKPANLAPHPDHVEIKHKDILVSYQDDGTIVETNGVVTRTFNIDGTIDIVNENSSLNITPEGVYTYTSSPVSVTVSPTGNLANITASTITLNGNVVVTGTSNLQGATTVGSTLGVTGAATMSSTLGVTGASSLGAVTSDGTDIGPSHQHSGVEVGAGTSGGVV